VLLSPLYRTKKKLRIWVGFGETVVVEGPGSDALTRRAASKVEISPLPNYPNVQRKLFVRGRITVDAREKG